MLWRYHIFILLIGVATSRIFSSATFQGSNGALGLSEDEIVEEIVQQLNAQKAKESKPDNRHLDGTEIPDGSTHKKAQTQFAIYANGGDGVNLEARSEADVTSDSKSKTGDAPNTSQDSSSSAQTEHGSQDGKQSAHAHPGRTAALSNEDSEEESKRILSKEDAKFAVFVGTGLAAGFIGIMLAGVCYYKFRRGNKSTSDIQYPAYGVTGPIKEKIPSPGDRKLAQSAQMYHYQHQKQQMIAMEKANGDMKHDASEDESEEDNVEGDYTVYECPGLAPTGEMEVKNPLFCSGEQAPPPPPNGHNHDPGDGHDHHDSRDPPSDTQSPRHP